MDEQKRILFEGLRAIVDADVYDDGTVVAQHELVAMARDTISNAILVGDGWIPVFERGPKEDDFPIVVAEFDEHGFVSVDSGFKWGPWNNDPSHWKSLRGEKP